MKLYLTLAAAVAQASSGYADAVFPAPGQHASYAIHDTMPRGGAYDATLILSGGTAESVTVRAAGKGTARVALENGAPTRLDRSLGMGFHLLEVANAVVQAGLAGKSSVSVRLGPPESEAATLQVRSSGGTITATGVANLPPPPPPEQQQAGPVHKALVQITATVVNGKLSSARGEMKPQDDGRAPADRWTVSRRP